MQSEVRRATSSYTASNGGSYQLGEKDSSVFEDGSVYTDYDTSRETRKKKQDGREDFNGVNRDRELSIEAVKARLIIFNF